MRVTRNSLVVSSGLGFFLTMGLAGLLMACSGLGARGGGPRVDGVTPARGSARGGEEVTVFGAGFGEGVRVWFGDAEGLVVERVSGEELRVTTPVHRAGEVDVVVRNPSGDEASRDDAFTFHPMELRFIEAAPHYLPTLEALTITDLAAADFDGDGMTDLLVGAGSGESRILRGNGAGGFTDAQDASSIVLPRWDSVTRRLVVSDFDGDGLPDLFVCAGSGSETRVFRNVGGERFEDVGLAFPAGRHGCVTAAAADLNGDGRLDLLVVGQASDGVGAHLTAHLNRADGATFSFEPVTSLSAAGEVEGVVAGTIWASLPEITGDYTFTHTQVWAGQTAGRLRYDFSASPGPGGRLMFLGTGLSMPELPVAVELELYGDASGHSLYLELRDSTGERFYKAVLPVAWSGWFHVRADDLASWQHELGNDDGVIDLPITEVNVGLVSDGSAPAVGELVIDDIALDVDSAGRVLVEDFERPAYLHQWDDSLSDVAVVDLDSDGRPEVIVSAWDSAAGAYLRLLANTTPSDAPDALRFLETTPSRIPAPLEAVSQIAAVDVDGDGDPDLVSLSPAGQDRVFVNDGAGFFFDDTVRAMPLDQVDGRSMAVADLNLDGYPDLLVANRDAVNRLYTGTADGRFLDHTPATPLQSLASEVIVILDVDGDGDLDFIVANGDAQGLRLYISVPPPGL